MAYGDVLSDMFYGLPAMRLFQREYEVRSLPGRHHMLHALNDAYAKSGVGAPGERMRIAIADWKEVPTYSEFVLFRDYFREMGYECVIADPREMEYVNGKLIVLDEQGKPFHATMVYKRVLLTELVTRSPEGLAHPSSGRSMTARPACQTPTAARSCIRKPVAVLSDERNEVLFSAAEVRAIRTFIPWTRELSERHTQDQGARVDLVPFARDNKDMLVLKPNDEYGGKGIVLGGPSTRRSGSRRSPTISGRRPLSNARLSYQASPTPALWTWACPGHRPDARHRPVYLGQPIRKRLPDPALNGRPAECHRRRRLNGSNLRDRKALNATTAAQGRKSVKAPTFNIGIEEQYQIVDPETRELKSYHPTDRRGGQDADPPEHEA